MSHSDTTLAQDCQAIAGDGAVAMTIGARAKDLGGFSVRRLLPAAQIRSVGPWVFFDHMGPAEFAAGKGVDVRPHPHINLATVTYLFEGEILHRDSLGSVRPIRPGDINLMVAGRGIVHSERERPEVRNRAHRVHGLQLWLALPTADEETSPAFYHYASAAIPAFARAGVPVRVMIGSAYGVTSPVRTYGETLYLEAQLTAGQTLVLPDAEERALYVVSGQMCAGDTPLGAHQMAVLRAGREVQVSAAADSRIALLGGEPLGERFIEWNFVSSRRERIAQAKADWQAGKFTKVPGDELESIPLPE